jgi:hypothetical protein
MDVYSGSTIPAFRRHVTIWMKPNFHENNGGGGVEMAKASRPCRFTMKDGFWCPFDKIVKRQQSLRGQYDEDKYPSTGRLQVVQAVAKLAIPVPNKRNKKTARIYPMLSCATSWLLSCLAFPRSGFEFRPEDRQSPQRIFTVFISI